MRLSRVVLLGLVLSAACATTDPPVHTKPDAAEPNDDHDAAAGDAAALDAGTEAMFDAGSDPNRNTAKPGHLCARVALIECAGEAACCERPGRDREQCLSQREQACVHDLGLDALSSSVAAGFDADLASAALAELEHRASTCDPQIAAWSASSQGLAASFAGTLGKNDDCMPEGGFDADADALVVALSSCQVGANLSCLPSTAAWTCVAKLSPRATCFSDSNCADGLYCADPSDAVDGVCLERLVAGETCARAGECESLVCHAGVCGADDDEQAAYCP